MAKGVTDMSRSRKMIARFIGGSLVAAACAGCQNNTQRGAAIGGVGGAALGAIVGKQLGNTGAGAAIGAVSGLAAGGLIGNAEDETEKKNDYARRAAYEHNLRVRQQRAV